MRFRVRVMWIAIAALAIAACTSATMMSEDESAKGGPRIVMNAGHFSKSDKAFRYWDKQKAVPAPCARCHTADGLAVYLRDGKNVAGPQTKNGFVCSNCHGDLTTYALRPIAKVSFPGGAVVDSRHPATNNCISCHQGRESTASVNKAIAGKAPDTPSDKLRFIHVHYAPAGATKYGTQVKVAYEYPGKSYAGEFGHVEEMNTCTACHSPHAPGVKIEKCSKCHTGVTNLEAVGGIRMSKGDFDGNGQEEGIGVEIAGLHRALGAAIDEYAKSVGKVGIAYYPSFPYWYNDDNGNGKVDPGEKNPKNGYRAWTPRLLQAVYNYTFVKRDPGAAVHNGRYTVQILHDSLESLSGRVPVDMKGKARP